MSNSLAAPPVHRGKLSAVKNLSEAFEHPDFLRRIAQATPKHLSSDRMLSVFVQSVQKTPKLRECSMMSLLGAFVSLASVGLEPNTALGHAYLIPFDVKRWNPSTKQRELVRTDVQVIFGYQGLLELTFRSRLVRSVHTDVVWKGDEFDFWYGSNAQLRHRPKGATREAEALPDYAYMHANLVEGGESFEVMPMDDVLRIRDNTQAYRSALAALKEAQAKGWKVPLTWSEAPWVKFLPQMSRKTVMRAGSKWLPKSIELAAVVAMDEAQDTKLLDFGAVIEGGAEVLSGLPEQEINDEPALSEDAGGGHTGYSQQPARLRRDPPPFNAVLIDEGGEILQEFTDPVLAAGGFAKFLNSAAAEDRSAILEHNADLIAELKKRGLWEEADAIDPLAIPLPQDPKPADVAAWVKKAVAAIAGLDAQTFPHWLGANQGTYRVFTATKRLEVDKALSGRAEALGLSWTPLRQTQAPDWKEWAAKFVEAVQNAGSLDDIDALVERQRDSLLRCQREDLNAHLLIEGALAARRIAG